MRIKPNFGLIYFHKFLVFVIVLSYLFLTNFQISKASDFIQEWKESSNSLPYNVANGKLFYKDAKLFLIGGSAKEIAFNNIIFTETDPVDGFKSCSYSKTRKRIL